MVCCGMKNSWSLWGIQIKPSQLSDYLWSVCGPMLYKLSILWDHPLHTDCEGMEGSDPWFLLRKSWRLCNYVSRFL